MRSPRGGCLPAAGEQLHVIANALKQAGFPVCFTTAPVPHRRGEGL
ncbi:MAG: hypothetical protein JSU62_05325 [Gammaproteobacteria bacterium]|nr:MAG: hypothetical protein JSU62_05325 [Gammaproteobacteria bacterium]